LLYEGLAMTIVYSLVASLFVAVTMVPLLSARLRFAQILPEIGVESAPPPRRRRSRNNRITIRTCAFPSCRSGSDERSRRKKGLPCCRCSSGFSLLIGMPWREPYGFACMLCWRRFACSASPYMRSPRSWAWNTWAKPRRMSLPFY